MKRGAVLRPGLAPGEVVVLYAEVPALPADAVALLARRLEADELARAERFRFEKDRTLFIAAHALLRHALSGAAGERAWRFHVDAYGKPELDPAWGDPPLRFNLSHTAGLAACALVRGHAVGVDVEAIDRRVDAAAIAESHFALEERRQLAAIPPGMRVETFLRFWTLKEAIIKAIGHGLSLPLQDFAFTLDPPSLAIAPGHGEDAACWHVEEYRPTTRHRLALAVRRPPGTRLAVAWHAVDLAAPAFGKPA